MTNAFCNENSILGDMNTFSWFHRGLEASVIQRGQGEEVTTHVRHIQDVFQCKSVDCAAVDQNVDGDIADSYGKCSSFLRFDSHWFIELSENVELSPVRTEMVRCACVEDPEIGRGGCRRRGLCSGLQGVSGDLGDFGIIAASRRP